ALSPTSIGLVLALRALVAAPIWPPNRALDCSTPRRAISFSVKSAREAAMGAADRVGALSSLMFPAPWLSAICGQFTQSNGSRSLGERRLVARSLRANVRFGSGADIIRLLSNVRFTLKADIMILRRFVRFVPEADIAGPLFDHLIGALLENPRHVEAEVFRCLQVDD